MELWFETTILNWKDYPDSVKEKKHRSIDRRFIALSKGTQQNGLVLAVATEAITYIGRCDADNYRALIAGASNATVDWSVVAQVGYCTSWLAEFSALHPDKAPAVEVQLALDEQLDHPQALALSGYLAGDYLNTHTTGTDYRTLRVRFAYQHIDDLWNIGFIREGFDFFLALPDDIRSGLLDADTTSALSVTVDGLPIQYPKRPSNLTLDLLAARYVLNDIVGSREMSVPASQLEASRSLLQCWHQFMPTETAGDNDCHTKDSLGKAGLADLIALTPSQDPYDFLEYYYSQEYFDSSSPTSGSSLWTQALCKRLGGDRYSSICETARQRLDPWDSNRFRDESEAAERAAAQSAFKIIAGSELSAKANLIEGQLIQAFGQPPKSATTTDHGKSIEPLPSAYVESKLPKALRSLLNGSVRERPSVWPAKYSALPPGFSPVRVDHLGLRVVVISVSQDLDPTGEVSAGGYWVHLSNDGGHSWQDPLYTGLAERFPYVVRSHSKLPVIAGDTLNVEVDIEELDTSSIMYPPVALRSRRRARDLYLRIPIAELRRDSDADGITDIVEKHLLLDPHNPDSDGDGIPDGQDSMPNVPRSSGQDPSHGAMAAIIEKMFDVRMRPIIEGIDSADGSDPVAGQFSTMRIGHTLPLEHPIFIEGDAADFATLNPNRLVLVYNKAQIAQLQRMTPDFHAISLSPLVLNNAGDRAYVVWSNGWTGGTFRLVREGARWRVLTLSQWIT
jgi:hypothetical protein